MFVFLPNSYVETFILIVMVFGNGDGAFGSYLGLGEIMKVGSS